MLIMIIALLQVMAALQSSTRIQYSYIQIINVDGVQSKQAEMVIANYERIPLILVTTRRHFLRKDGYSTTHLTNEMVEHSRQSLNCRPSVHIEKFSLNPVLVGIMETTLRVPEQTDLDMMIS
jgi:hypothetical protein